MDIFGTLGVGSGLDTQALVRDLVAAQRAPATQALDRRQERVDARISALGQFRSALSALSSALTQRIGSGSVSARPFVSDPSVLALAVGPGQTIPTQSVRVDALATAQTLIGASVPDSAAPIGEGTLTIRFGGITGVAGTGEPAGFTPGAVPDLVVTIGPGQSSLTGIRDAIASAAVTAGAPLSASIVNDAGGARLVLRGDTGEAAGFVVETADAPLASFRFQTGTAPGLSRSVAAGDARILVDGVPLRRTANSFSDAIPGARVTLLKAEPATPVTVSAARDTEELKAVVRDVAAALDELSGIGRELSRGQTATASAGALAADGTTRRVLQTLGGLVTQSLYAAPEDTPARLSDIGVTLTREGAIRIDEARLARAAEDHPAAIEAIVRTLGEPRGLLSLGGPLARMEAQLAEAVDGRFGQPSALRREADAIARDRTALEARMARFEEATRRQFSALDQSVGRTRDLERFLQTQIDIWFGTRDR
jgi:flagellar hook-associated protein 2